MDALIYLLWTNFELITLLSPQCTFRYYESGYKLVYYHVNKSKYISCEDICIKEGIDSYIHVTCLYIVYMYINLRFINLCLQYLIKVNYMGRNGLFFTCTQMFVNKTS